MSQQVGQEINKLILEGQKRLVMSGVDTVDGFSDQMLKLTVGGSKVVVMGENVKITAFNKETGNLSAVGNFYEIKYLKKKEPLGKRLFK